MRPKSFFARLVAVGFIVMVQVAGNTASADGIDVYPLLVSKLSEGVAHLHWPDPVSSYDIVRGSLRLLRESNGAFAIATEQCRVDDVIGSSFDDADLPEAGESFWYLVRWDQSEGFPEWGAQTYNEDTVRRAHQAVNRDAGIEASTQDCGCYYFCCYDHPGQCFSSRWP
jgi:hypothetical protein